MVKLNKIYTRTGDGGSAGLVDGSRVSKSSARMAAIGEVDEANCATGVAIAALAPGELAERLRSGERIRLIDVREPHELEISRIAGAELIPLGSLAAHLHELDSAEEIVLFCKSGSRSARAVELLAGAGFRKQKNLRGGINAWAQEVEPSLPIY